MINKVSNVNYNFKSNVNFKGEDSTNLALAPAVESSETNSAVPVSTLMAYMMKKPDAAGNVEVKFLNAPSINELQAKYGNAVKADISDLASRAGKSGQVLNWINVLPETQIQRLDEIYALADSMKQNNGKLGIIGIGGSRHTIENMLSLNGRADNVEFLSAVDPESINKFIEKLGDLKTANIMVASKSGTTLEPSVGFEYVEKVFVEKLGKEEAAKHFVCITDKDETKSKLGKIAKEKGYNCGVIHDECGGRFGAFDDHSLVALAYSGMKKEDMKKMLEASIKAQKKFLNSDLTQNQAAQRAMFNADSIQKGKHSQFDYYFGDAFEGTKLWNTQMKKESHKAQYTVSGDLIGPAFLHNSTESDLDSGNKTSFYTFNTIKNNGSADYKAYNSLINGSLKAYSERHPVSLMTLKDLSPESVGEFVELKHFETMLTGMLLRSSKGEKHPEVLPEVEQPSVKIYKKEVEAILKD